MNKQLHNIKVFGPLALALSFAAGLWMGKIVFNHSSSHKEIDKLSAIMELIADSYVDEIDTDSLLEATIPDLIAKLDPHSVYIAASDLENVNSELEGSFSGIGISFNRLNDTISVIEVISGGPSERVGLLPGDRIVTINDTTALGNGWTDEKVISMLRGPKDTVVKLGIKRPSSEKLLTYEVTRGDIPVNTVDASYIIDDGVGYIKVNKFGRTTYDEFIQAMGLLRSQGARKYILDLRGNGGGFMEMAVLMANEFLPSGKIIVSTKGRGFKNDDVIGSDGNGSFQNEEVAVLIDEFSASSSEILAGAIQDNDRGVVIGRRSFGKGLVQQQYALPDSSALRLTISRYYTPSGRCIQKNFARGDSKAYNSDIIERFSHGEAYNADSVKLDMSTTFFTLGGRPVYGGGGIMPDIFVGSDTVGLTTYYLDVSNAGLLHRYAFNYYEKNRDNLRKSKNLNELLSKLPTDTEILKDFANYAAQNGVPQPFWRTVNQSRAMIVKTIKAVIARDALGSEAFYEVYNSGDKTIDKALETLFYGSAKVLAPRKSETAK